MRVVARPHDVLDPEPPADQLGLYGVALVDEGGVDLAVKVEARELLDVWCLVALAADQVVGDVDPPGDPSEAGLYEHQLEVGESLEHAGRDPEAERFPGRQSYRGQVGGSAGSGVTLG